MRFFKIIAAFLFIINLGATTISSLNIRNFNTKGPYPTVLSSLERILQSNTSDLYAFQEIVDVENFTKMLLKTLPDHRVISSKCGGYGKQRLSFVYNSNKYKVLEYVEDIAITGKGGCDSGVRPLLKIKIQNIESSDQIWAVLVHLKAGAKLTDITFRRSQLQYIQRAVAGLENYFIVGDFNTTNFFNSSGEYFKDFISINRLTHSSSTIECSSYWWGGVSDGLYHPSLLDHILLSPKLAKKYKEITFSNNEHCSANSCQISNTFELGESFKDVSDHCPVTAKLIRN